MARMYKKPGPASNKQARPAKETKTDAAAKAAEKGEKKTETESGKDGE